MRKVVLYTETRNGSAFIHYDPELVPSDRLFQYMTTVKQFNCIIVRTVVKHAQRTFWRIARWLKIMLSTVLFLALSCRNSKLIN